LEKRLEEQSEILQAASAFVKPNGALLYATCSFLMEEDEDRVAEFLAHNNNFAQESAADAAIASNLLTEAGVAAVKRGQGPQGSVRLTPRRAGTDGFFFAVLRRN
jgi:16S rRNA (cytosine967-C5)-methyltransferase